MPADWGDLRMTEYDYLMRMVVATEWEKPTSADYRQTVDYLIGEPEFKVWLRRNPFLVIATDLRIDRCGHEA